MSYKKPSLLVLGVGLALLTGTLDALAAILLNPSVGPVRIFLFVASGFFGKDAFTGGTPMLIYGILFHYAIAAIFTTFFLAMYRQLRLEELNRFVTAIVYGGLIWAIMNLIVLPNSHVMKFPFDIDRMLLDAGTLIVCIGFPLAFVTPWYIHKKANPAFA